MRSIPPSMLAAGLLAAGVAAFIAWWPDDLERVERRTRELLASLEKEGPESLPVSAARTLDTVSMLATNAVLRLGDPFPSALRKSDIAPLLQQIRMRVDRLSVKERGLESERGPDDAIRVDATLEAKAVYQGQTEEILGSYRMTWVKDQEGTWKMAGAEGLELIRHPSATAW